MRILWTLALIATVASCQTASNGDHRIAKNELSNAEERSEGSLKDTDEDRTDPIETASTNPKASEAKTLSVEAYTPPKTGTVFTWRNNWANLPDLISYKVAGRLTLGSSEYLKLTSVRGFKNETHAYYDTKTFSLKGYRDKADRAIVTIKPPEQRYRFPMQPGDQWITNWKSIDHKTDRVTSGGGVVRVMRWETLNLPAGAFRTLKVKMPVQRGAPKGLTHYTWFSPELGVTVKEEIGGGILNWYQVLEKIEHPK